MIVRVVLLACVSSMVAGDGGRRPPQYSPPQPRYQQTYSQPPVYHQSPASYKQRPQASYKPQSPPTYKPEPRPTYKPQSPPTYKPEPRPTYKPQSLPTYKPEPRPTYKPEPRPTYKPDPRPTYKPEPTYHTERQPSYTPEPTKKPSPPASYKPRPTPSYQPKPQQAYKPQPSYEDEPAKYQYEYSVQDEYSGVDFGAEEQRNGYQTSGSYHVLLPDGRVQTVTYRVDDQSGFVADVTYEGEAQYPSQQPHQEEQKYQQRAQYDANTGDVEQAPRAYQS